VLIPALLLCLLLALFSRSLQRRLQVVVHSRTALIFLAPLLLTAVFCATASFYECLSLKLAALIAAYTFVPTALIYAQCARSQPNRASILDFAVVLLLWLPLEFAAGAALVPRRAQGVLHATAYAIAVALGVLLFAIVRRWSGMKYGLPRSFLDLRNILLGYSASVLLLIPLGLWIGFLARPHLPRISLPTAALRILLIFFGTAFPEEILFRGLIQNWFTQRLQQPWSAVAVSGLIFGASHLNNAPGPLPNWRYMAVGIVAGLIFGSVFLRSTSILASAAVHAAVNTTKYLFF
jgi:uncharacterized protein